MKASPPDPYTTLGLHRACTEDEIRKAYRLLAKRHHPDLNPGDPAATARTRALNEAYQLLLDPLRRQALDRELARAAKREHANRPPPALLKQDALVSPAELLRGTTLTVHVHDPVHPAGRETYEVDIPAGTAPGTRFRIPRSAPLDHGVVQVRVKARPDARFKPRGSDVRCELRISLARAASGGSEVVPGLAGKSVRVVIPPRVARGTILRVPGEGLPKPHGGRGDLLVRIRYRPEVRVTGRSRGSG